MRQAAAPRPDRRRPRRRGIHRSRRSGWVDLWLRGQPGERCPRVGGQAVLRRSARIAAVSAVVEQQHRQAQPGQPAANCARTDRSPAVAIDDQDGGPLTASCGQIPSAQTDSVFSLEDDVASAR